MARIIFVKFVYQLGSHAVPYENRLFDVQFVQYGFHVAGQCMDGVVFFEAGGAGTSVPAVVPGNHPERPLEIIFEVGEIKSGTAKAVATDNGNPVAC